jgi:hypothetical protein
VAGEHPADSDESTGRPKAMPRATVSRGESRGYHRRKWPLGRPSRHAKRSTLWRGGGYSNLHQDRSLSPDLRLDSISRPTQRKLFQGVQGLLRKCGPQPIVSVCGSNGSMGTSSVSISRSAITVRRFRISTAAAANRPSRGFQTNPGPSGDGNRGQRRTAQAADATRLRDT